MNPNAVHHEKKKINLEQMKKKHDQKSTCLFVAKKTEKKCRK